MLGVNISVADFCDDLSLSANGLLGKAVRVFTPSGGHVDASILSVAASGARNAPLVIVFHGFVDQEKRSLPVFDGLHLVAACTGKATILAISDSTLEKNKRLKVGWYLGSADHDLPAEIACILDALRKALTPGRMIFVGGSTGAHAALYHSIRYPDSLVIAANPLTCVSDFHAQHVSLYLQVCWPGLQREEVLGGYRIDDASQAYKNAFANKLVVLQNCTDHYLMGPVLRSMLNVGVGSSTDPLSVIFLSEFFGSHVGHTYPAAPIAKWVNAACTYEGGDLLGLSRFATKTSVTPADNTGTTKTSLTSMDARDLQIAELL